jgi:hypothetical protein
MTGNKKWFFSLTPLSHKEYVTFGDDKKGKVLRVGVIKVNDCFTLNDVTLVDRLRYNLISVSQLCDTDLSVFFVGRQIDIGDGITPMPTFVNKNMSLEHKDAIIKLLKEYVDCFNWNYHEMPVLSRELVEHRLPIKSGFRPYKQPAWRFNLIIHDQVKEEVEQLLDAGFIRPCQYTEWVSNIVPVKKKNTGKIQVCINFRNLNKATLKMNIICL